MNAKRCDEVYARLLGMSALRSNLGHSHDGWLQPKAVIASLKSMDSHENLRVLNGTEDSLWRNNLPLSGPI